MRSVAVLCFISTFCLLAHPVHADSAEDRAAADALFKEARTLLDHKNFADACPKFAASQKLDPRPGRLLALGDCYEQNGDTASAWATFREAASAAKATKDDAREKEGNRRVSLLEPNLSKLIVNVPQNARIAGLEVLRNGSILDEATWGTAIPVDPGPQLVEARAPGKHSWSITVDIPSTPGTTTTEIPQLTADPSGQGKPMNPAATSRGKSIPLIIVGGTLGIVGIATGIGLVAASGGLKADAVAMRDSMPEAACNSAHPMHDNYAVKCNALANTLAKKDTFWNTAAALFPIGGTFAIGTWAYTLIPRSTFKKSAFMVLPVVTPAYSGFVAVGAF